MLENELYYKWTQFVGACEGELSQRKWTYEQMVCGDSIWVIKLDST